MRLINKPMKRLSLYLFLILFTLQTPSLADDIRDFQIEGMSIGDSVLKYYDKDIIDKRIAHWPGSKKYIKFWDNNFKSEIYESLQLIYLTNDSNYIIKGIAAGILYRNDPISKCYNRQAEVFEEIKSLFPNTKIKKGKKNKHRSDDSGKSTYKNIYFRFDNGDTVAIGCYDWSKKINEEKGWIDHFRISIYDNDHRVFLQAEAFK